MTRELFRKWLLGVIRELEPAEAVERDYLDEDHYCRQALREAAGYAADLGLDEAYERCEKAQPDLVQTRSAMAFCLRQIEEEPEYLTPPEAARLLGVNPDKVRCLIRSGKLPAINTSRRPRPRWRIARTDVENLRQVATPKPPQRRPKREPSVTEYF